MTEKAASRPAFREDLDRMLGNVKCNCGTQHRSMFVHARCHPASPTWSEYHTDTGRIVISCAQCQQTILTVAVARRLVPQHGVN